eukprot:COSAG01_NODE_41634_length_449_cov_0.554286_1_plen_89_part_10
MIREHAEHCVDLRRVQLICRLAFDVYVRLYLVLETLNTTDTSFDVPTLQFLSSGGRAALSQRHDLLRQLRVRAQNGGQRLVAGQVEKSM